MPGSIRKRWRNRKPDGWKEGRKKVRKDGREKGASVVEEPKRN